MTHSPSGKRLTSKQIRTSLVSFNWSAGLRSVYDTICGGATFVFVAFALSLGVQKEQMGLITSVAGFACIVQILVLPLTHVIQDKKRFILAVGLAEPLLMVIAVLVVPFLPGGLRLPALAVAIFMAAASLHLTRPLADDWIASTIPPAIRGRYLGRRFQAISVFSIISMLAVGYAAQRIGATNTVGLGYLLTFGGVFGFLSVLALRPASMPILSASSRVTWQHAREALRHRLFRRYVCGLLLYNLPFFFAVPYYQVLNLRVLHMSESLIAAMIAGYNVMKILTMPFFGRLVDRKGARWVAYAIAPIYVLFFAGLALSAPGRVWPVILVWAIAGIGDGGFTVAVTMAQYAAIPENSGRPLYFAVASLLTTAAFGLGALVSVPIAGALRSARVQIGTLELGQFHCLYAACAILMVFAMFGAHFFSDRAK